jgi:hypothetical protein
MSERDNITKRIDEAETDCLSASAATCVALVASGGWTIAGGHTAALVFFALAGVIGATAFMYRRRVNLGRKQLALCDATSPAPRAEQPGPSGGIDIMVRPLRDMKPEEAVCRTISTYYAPDGTRRLYRGTLTEGDGGKHTNANNCAAYVNGALVKFAQVVHRGAGETANGDGWVVAFRLDEAGKVVPDEKRNLTFDLLTGKVEVVIGGKPPFAERIDE